MPPIPFLGRSPAAPVTLSLPLGAGSEALAHTAETASAGDLDSLRLFLKGRPDAERKQSLAIVLLLAARNGRPDIVRYSLDNGAHIDSRDEDGRTALFLASAYRHLDLAIFLMKRGADAGICASYMMKTGQYHSAAGEWLRGMDSVNPIQLAVGVGPDAATSRHYGKANELFRAQPPPYPPLREPPYHDETIDLDTDALEAHQAELFRRLEAEQARYVRELNAESAVLEAKMKDILRLVPRAKWIFAIDGG